MNLVEQYAPKLRDQWLTLEPFQDVIPGYTAGPQPQCINDSMDDPQHIHLDFSEWRDGEIVVSQVWIIREEGVFLKLEGELYESSMGQLWNFLRQLPRPAHSFCS